MIYIHVVKVDMWFKSLYVFSCYSLGQLALIMIRQFSMACGAMSISWEVYNSLDAMEVVV